MLKLKKIVDVVNKIVTFILYAFMSSAIYQELPDMIRDMQHGLHYEPASMLFIACTIVWCSIYAAKLIKKIMLIVTYWTIIIYDKIESKNKTPYIWRSRPRKSHIKVR